MSPLCRSISWHAMVACFAVFVSSCNEQDPVQSPTTETKSVPVVSAPAGEVEGQVEGVLHVFKGIPYAKPPVGPARWTPPSALPRWSGIKKATQFGSNCVQPVRRVDSIYSEDFGLGNEDCLTLNIWAPADATDAPVFVWYHGGALTVGASSVPFYDGARLAEQGIVVVSANFRIGILGYLAHPELSAESPLGISGNYGLLDQVEVLRWVNKNIGAFGGNPSNVTIVGESSGALGVMYLMATPSARGLFSKAIMQSAYMISSPELKQSSFGVRSAEDTGLSLATMINSPDLESLRAMDAQELTEAVVATGYITEATIDGHVLPRQILEIFNNNEQAPVPILAGLTSGEIRSLRVLAPPPPETSDIYESIIHDRYLDLADEFLRLYPSDSMLESTLATTRDALYGWTAERLVKSQTALGQPSFLYYFDHGYPEAEAANLHAFHASELPYMFGNIHDTPRLWPKIPDTLLETRLSNAMVGYWSSFARSGQPSAENEPDWPPYGSTKAYMAFRDVPYPSEHLLPGMFELHEEAVCRRWASGQYPWNWNVGIISPQLTPDEEGRCP